MSGEIVFVEGSWRVKASKGSMLPGIYMSQLKATRALRRYNIQSEEMLKIKAAKKDKKEK